MSEMIGSDYAITNKRRTHKAEAVYGDYRIGAEVELEDGEFLTLVCIRQGYVTEVATGKSVATFNGMRPGETKKVRTIDDPFDLSPDFRGVSSRAVGGIQTAIVSFVEDTINSILA